jgi:hypothetical protein
MSIDKIQSAITSKVWQAIAHSQIDLSQVPREEVNKLVDLVVDAALQAVDGQLEVVNQTAAPPSVVVEGEPQGEEVILWEGRPFLSLTRHYQITNERIRITEGLFGKDREDIELVRVQDIDQSQNLTERALNLGDIHIRSHDPSHPEVLLENIQDPQQVHEILRRAVIKAREKYRLSYREEM